MASLSSINIVFRVNNQELSTQLQNSVREMKKYGAALQDVGRSLSLYVTAPLVAAGAAAVNQASDMQESQNKVDVAFGKSAASVNAFAQTSLTSFGIAEGSALDMAALFGDMATSMGLPQGEAAKLSTSLVGLAGDLASFKNINIEEATTALNGVFTGETESLKRLGIVMTEANLAQFALSRGITKSIKDFTQAEKVQLRYAYVMANTVNAQGDFARTGGGAANQMRVFTESLKELGAQFGQYILPAFTGFLQKVNSAIASFKDLNPQSQKLIVTIAGIGAAIGPVVFAVGSLIKGYVNMRATMVALQPQFLTIAAAVGVAFLAYKALSGQADKLTASQRNMQDINRQAAQSVSAEREQLDRLVAVAKDDNLEKKERNKALKELQAISPEYLGNLKLEEINTKATADAIDKYIKKLEDKAKAQAAQSKREQLFAERLNILDAPLGEAKNIMDDILSVIYKKLGIDTTGVIIKNKQELEEYIKTLKLSGKAADALRQVYAPYLAQKEADVKAIDDQIAALRQYAVVSEDVTVVSGGHNEVTRKTVSYYEALIDKLQKANREWEVTPAAIQRNKEKIAEYQKEIDRLNGTRVAVASVFEGFDKVPEPQLKDSASSARVKVLQAEKQAYEEIQKTYTSLDPEFKKIQDTIDAYDFNIKLAMDPSQVITATQSLLPVFDELAYKQEQLSQIAVAVGDGVAGAFESMTGRWLDSLGAANDGLQGFFKGLASVVIKIISAMLAQSIAQSIASATTAAAATGPAAIFTQPAFIAEMLAGVFAAFAAIPKFETGGIVGGSSFTGDRLFARINSGEMILNQRQQERVWGMINPAPASADLLGQLEGMFTLRGEEMVLMIERANKTMKRNR